MLHIPKNSLCSQEGHRGFESFSAFTPSLPPEVTWGCSSINKSALFSQGLCILWVHWWHQIFHQGNERNQQNQQPTLLKTQAAKLAMSMKYGMGKKRNTIKISIQHKLGSDGTRALLLSLSPVTTLLSIIHYPFCTEEALRPKFKRWLTNTGGQNEAKESQGEPMEEAFL